MARRVYDHFDWPVIRGVSRSHLDAISVIVSKAQHITLELTFTGLRTLFSKADIILMCTGITVTRRYVPRSRRTNKVGSKIGAHAVVTMETSSAFLRSRGFPTGWIGKMWR